MILTMAMVVGKMVLNGGFESDVMNDFILTNNFVNKMPFEVPKEPLSLTKLVGWDCFKANCLCPVFYQHFLY